MTEPTGQPRPCTAPSVSCSASTDLHLGQTERGGVAVLQEEGDLHALAHCSVHYPGPVTVQGHPQPPAGGAQVLQPLQGQTDPATLVVCVLYGDQLSDLNTTSSGTFQLQQETELMVNYWDINTHNSLQLST